MQSVDAMPESAHDGPPSTVQSVERAIAVLQCFSRQKPERGVNELSREMGLHKSIVSRLVVTLERGGLLSRNPDTGRYRLGIELLTLASEVASFLDVREVARPVLRALAESCQETVNIAVLDGRQVVDIDQFVVQTRRTMTLGWVGRRMPVHCTAAGKVLLAYLSAAQLEDVLSAGLERLTPTTMVDGEELKRQVREARERGFATSLGELEEGMNAVAAPVHDRHGRVECAVSVAGPAYRLTPAQVSQTAISLMAATEKISRQLGYDALRGESSL
jgi:IclR family transcriptional regulator, acetate operon repressor